MQISLKLVVTGGLVALVAIGLNMVVPNENISFAEGGNEGETLFQANCSGCHSLGGGNGVGPDLMGITEIRDSDWLVQMIQDPQSLVDSGDQTANQLVEEYGMVMPKINLSSAEVDVIVSYLESLSSQESGAAKGQQLTLPMFALYGFVGALILFVMMGVIWRGRLKGVRKNLH